MIKSYVIKIPEQHVRKNFDFELTSAHYCFNNDKFKHNFDIIGKYYTYMRLINSVVVSIFDDNSIIKD